jgi:hypothetical protein
VNVAVDDVPDQSSDRAVVGCAYCGAMSNDDTTKQSESNQSEATRPEAAGGSSGNTASQETLGGARPDPANTASKDPSEWVTGDEPMTGPQRSYLDTLAREAGQELPADLTKAEASQHIDELQQATGRGTDTSS